MIMIKNAKKSIALHFLMASLGAGALLYPAEESLANSSFHSGEPVAEYNQFNESVSKKCSDDEACIGTKIAAEKLLRQNPHIYNTFSAALNSDPEMGKLVLDGYKNRQERVEGLDFGKEVAGVIAPVGRYAGVPQAILTAVDLVDGDDGPEKMKIEYNTSQKAVRDGLMTQEQYDKEKGLLNSEKYGRRNEDIEKSFETGENSAELEKASYVVSRLHNIHQASQENDPSTDSLKESLAKDLKQDASYVDGLLELYDSVKNSSLPGTGNLDIDMDAARKMAAEYGDQIQSMLENKREIDDLRQKLETEQGDKQDLEKRIAEIEEKQKEEARLLQKEIYDKSVEDFEQKQSDEASGRDGKAILEEARNNPAYVGGKPVYSSNRRGYEAVGATADFAGAFLTFMGGGNEVQKYVAMTHATLRAMDSIETLRELEGFSSAEDITVAMTSMTSIVGWMNVGMSLMAQNQKSQMDYLMEHLQTVLKNQIEMLDSINDLKSGQATVLGHLRTLDRGVKDLLKRQYEQTRIMKERFDRLERQSSAQYKDMIKLVKGLKVGSELNDYINLLIKYENQDSLSLLQKDEGWFEGAIKSVFGDSEKEKQAAEDMTALGVGMIKIEEIARTIYHAPTSGYKSSLGQDEMVLDGGTSAEDKTKALPEDRRSDLPEIMKRLCVNDDSCSKFENVADAEKLKGLMYLYFRGANVLAASENGRAFLQANIDQNTMERFGEAIRKTQEASKQARYLLPEAAALYAQEIKNFGLLLDHYMMSGVVAMGGTYVTPVSKIEAAPLAPSFMIDEQKNSVTEPGKKKNLWGLVEVNGISVTKGIKDGESLDLSILFRPTPPFGMRRGLDKWSIGRLKPDIQFELAQYHGIGVPGKDFTRVDRQAENAGIFGWTLRHVLSVKNPLYINNGRLDVLFKDQKQGRDMVERVRKSKWLPNLLGSSNITSEKTHIIRGGMGAPRSINRACSGKRIVFSFGPIPQEYIWCVHQVQSDWLTTNKPITKAPNKSHLQTVFRELDGDIFHVPKAQKGYHISNDYNRIRNNLLEALRHGSFLTRLANNEAVRQIQDALLEQWKQAAIGHSPSFAGVPMLEDNKAIEDPLSNLQKSLQRLSDARLAYDTALRVGYGQDCMEKSPDLKTEADNIEGHVYPAGSDFLELAKKRYMYDATSKWLEYSNLQRSFKILSEKASNNDFPDAKKLEGTCAVGYGGIEQVNDAYEAYQNWVKNAVKP